MDDAKHAPVMKQCMECHHWALLTHENWPKSSRENPSKSCCRKCRAVKGLYVEDGDSDEDIISALQQVNIQQGGKVEQSIKSKEVDRSIMASRWAFTPDKKAEESKADGGKRKSQMAATMPTNKPTQRKQMTPSRDIPPHMTVPNMRMEARDFERSSQQENVKPVGSSQLSEQNKKLFEAIEKMEKRNRERLALQSISNRYLQDPRHAWQ